MRRTLRRGLATAIALALGTAAAPLTAVPAQAFKPYTHNSTAQPALADVVDDGSVTIGGRDYAVDPGRAGAQHLAGVLQAGVIGPDGFPDLTFGQSTIHPRDGQVDRVLRPGLVSAVEPGVRRPSAARSSPSPTGTPPTPRATCGRTRSSTTSRTGIFPSVGEIVTDVDKAEIALRHIIVEGYIGDATEGYDGNADRTPLAGRRRVR